jgi:hypothetical protein
MCCVGLIDCSHGSRSGASFSGLGSKIFLPSPFSLRPYPIEVAGFEQILWVVLVEAGSPDPWTPWQAPTQYGKTVQKTVLFRLNRSSGSPITWRISVSDGKKSPSVSSFWLLWPVASPGFQFREHSLSISSLSLLSSPFICPSLILFPFFHSF